jgi:ATP-binding cassette, subfamily B, bacterial MsbA
LKQLSRLLRYARPYFPALVASVILMSVVGLSQAMILFLIPLVFGRVLNPNSPDTPAKLFSIPHTHFVLYLNDFFPSSVHNIWTLVAFSLMACFLAKGLCDYAGNYLVNWVGISAVNDLRQEVFDRVLRQDSRFFEDHTTGQIMSSIMNDIDRIQVSTSTMLADWLRQFFTALFILLTIVLLNWRLSLISLLVFPLVALLTTRLGRRIRKTTRQVQDRTAGLNQILQETISGHQVVKSFGAEDFESKRFRLASARWKAGNLKYTAHQALASPIIEFLGALTVLLLLYLARQQVKNTTMTAAAFTQFVVGLVMLYEPIKRLTNIHNIFQQGLGAAQSVFHYLDSQPDVIDAPDAKQLLRLENSISFRDVRFFYPARPSHLVLDGIDFEIRAGEVVALVGPSGAGKTTLGNLVPRFYDVTSGSIQIDGQDVRGFKLGSLRENVSVVSQETFLFNDTVFDNIAYGRPDAKEEEVYDAARTALADEFIARLPHGYRTVIGERGAKLSGGQRQRLAIARALLKDAPILILDEATSNLDNESERLVQQALTALMKKRTVLVIAHRLSTVRHASKIVVLENGRIVETGTHDDLVAAHGLYRHLYDLQFAGSQALAENRSL